MSLLCQKKDIIIQKFDELLKKLGGEELSANITMGRVTKEWKEAMEVRTRPSFPHRITPVGALRGGQLAEKAASWLCPCRDRGRHVRRR